MPCAFVNGFANCCGCCCCCCCDDTDGGFTTGVALTRDPTSNTFVLDAGVVVDDDDDVVVVVVVTKGLSGCAKDDNDAAEMGVAFMGVLSNGSDTFDVTGPKISNGSDAGAGTDDNVMLDVVAVGRGGGGFAAVDTGMARARAGARAGARVGAGPEAGGELTSKGLAC